MNKKKYPFTQNREISWLMFNQRVLEEAGDISVPLLERLKFVAIFTSNLDEFFMVRVGSLTDMILVDDTQCDSKSGLRPSEQLSAIFAQTKKLYTMRDHIAKSLFKTLKAMQICSISYSDLNKKELKHVSKYFETALKPLLAPQIIDLHHPFPFLHNKELYVFFQMQEGGKKKYGIIPIPDFLDRVIYLNEEKTQFVLVEDIILNNLDKLFGKAKILNRCLIRVTRNADINLNSSDIEEDEDYRQFMKKILKRRTRLAPVRLEVLGSINEESLNFLSKQLHLPKAQIFQSRNVSLEPDYLFQIIGSLPAPVQESMSYQPMQPQTVSTLNPDAPMIPQILDHDVFLSYPYQDIDLFIQLLKECSSDPQVVAIRITIYRLAKHSKVVHYLCRAAENGKQVTVLMELRARFDEQNNIENAERLEEAGCTVIYGFENYKVHSKLLSISLQTRTGPKTITQIGTGNYNEKTSHQYTDFSLITADPAIGQDALAFFQNMNTSNLNGQYDLLLVSPDQLKAAVLAKLDHQIELAKQGKEARADFKMNSLTDLDIIAKLAEASSAGVKIRMIVRGICCLLPGLEGYTDNIEIHQIVGRFLEHGRIYIFGTGKDQEIYISSADFMTRNTERRVEVAVPVHDKQARERLIDYFDIQFKDDAKGRGLLPSGYYTRVQSSREEPLNAQEYFIKQAVRLRYVPVEKKETFQDRLGRLFHFKKKGPQR